MITFYQYLHCPFCQRVRLGLSYKRIPYKSVVLSYADEETPQRLIGKKMLPILQFPDKSSLPESVDILRALEDAFPQRSLFIGVVEADIEFFSKVVCTSPRYFDLLLPYYLEAYAQAPEFQEGGATYFRQKKEAKRQKTFEQLKGEGPEIFRSHTLPMLESVKSRFHGHFVLPFFSVLDCILAADLNGLRLLPFTIPSWVEEYLARVEVLTGENLLSVRDPGGIED